MEPSRERKYAPICMSVSTMAWFPTLHAVWMGSASSRAGSGLLKYTPSLMSRMAWSDGWMEWCGRA